MKYFHFFLNFKKGNGVFASDGVIWKHHRKVASHMFSARLLRHTLAVGYDVVRCIEFVDCFLGCCLSPDTPFPPSFILFFYSRFPPLAPLVAFAPFLLFVVFVKS